MVKKYGGLVGSGPSKGGGIFNGETLTLQNVRVTNNQAIGDATDMLAFGGGIYNNGTLTVDQCIIENNYAKAYDDNQRYACGGGIYSYNSTTITIENSTISSNKAQGGDHYYAGTAQGGGIYLDSPSSASINGSTISNNTAQGGNGSSNGGALGGGIVWTNGWANYVMKNSTISGNQAVIGNIGVGYGGGIHGTSVSSFYLILQNCTVANNSATSQGGGVFCYSSQKPIWVRDCIIADNNAPSGPDIMNTITTLDYNLIESTDGWSYYYNSVAGSGNSSVHNITGVDPKLSALADNNSSYGPQTHHIASDSPARDAGTSTGAESTDQRGANRNGVVDIGAYEYWDNLGGLPVELTSFSANVNNGGIQLTWQTATEVNNYGFEVEVSTNLEAEQNRSWETIGFIEGHGNSNSVKDYSFTDTSTPLRANKINYRLKQIDTDGSYEYSEIVSVKLDMPIKYKLVQNYPNPFNPSTVIEYAIPEKTNARIFVFNSIGEEVAVLVNQEMNAGYHTVKFNANQLSSGIYFYRITAGEFVATKKMLLIK